MSVNLGALLIGVRCPSCGAGIDVPWRQVRFNRAAFCRCRLVVRLSESTELRDVRKFINGANPVTASNDA